MKIDMKEIFCVCLVLPGSFAALQANAQFEVFGQSAEYEAEVGNLLLSADFTSGTNSLVSGRSFDQLVVFTSIAPGSPSVFSSAAAGGIQNATSASGGLSAVFAGLSNALALRFSASPTPPTVTLYDGAGALIDTRTASASGFYGVLSPTSVRTVQIVPAPGGVLTLEEFQANQEAVPQSDTTPPRVVSLSIDPPSVDVTGSAQTATVDLEITDDLAGISTAFLRFISPSNQQATNTVSASMVGGDPLNQTRRAVVTFPRFIESGDWRISVSVRDVVSNASTVPIEALATLGLPTTIAVTSDDDTDPPVLTSLGLSATEVDVSGGDQALIISLGLSDAVAGVRRPRTLRVHNPSSDVFQYISGGAFTLISGSPLDGVWQGVLTIPQFSEAGIWTIDIVGADDEADNDLVLRSGDLNALGFPSGFTVISNPQDLQSPQLLAFNFSPALVNTTAGPESVSVSMRLTDDLAGVQQNFFLGSGPPFVQFRSPSGEQNRFTRPGLVSGTSFDGNWEGQIFFPQFSEQGNYRPDVGAWDLVGNSTRLFQTDLQDLGFATNLVVIRPSLIIDGTIIPADGGTVIDDVFGSSASIFFPPDSVDVPTDVAIDVFTVPPINATPVGFQAVGSLFVNIDLMPEPTYPLPPPGLTVTLPMSPPGVPGTSLVLFRVNPATLALEPVFNFDGTLLTGTVNPDGQSATFFGIRFLSLVVGFVPADPGDLNADDCVDRSDYAIISDAIRDPETASILLDLNGDGAVNRADARTLIGLFTNPNGMPCSIANELINPPVDPRQLRR